MTLMALKHFLNQTASNKPDMIYITSCRNVVSIKHMASAELIDISLKIYSKIKECIVRRTEQRGR